jgi:hypothetical protein
VATNKHNTNAIHVPCAGFRNVATDAPARWRRLGGESTLALPRPRQPGGHGTEGHARVLLQPACQSSPKDRKTSVSPALRWDPWSRHDNVDSRRFTAACARFFLRRTSWAILRVADRSRRPAPLPSPACSAFRSRVLRLGAGVRSREHTYERDEAVVALHVERADARRARTSTPLTAASTPNRSRALPAFASQRASREIVRRSDAPENRGETP